MELSDYRARIDQIDRQLVELFAQRMNTAAGIAAYKKEHGLSLEMTIWTQHFQRTAFWAMKQSASRRSIPIRPLNPKNARWF